MHLYLSSHPTEHFPENTYTDFTVQLPQALIGNWRLGATEVNLPFSPKTALFLCSDLCTESIVNEHYLPVLCQLTRKTYQPGNISYIPAKTTHFHTLRIFICDKSRYVQKAGGRGETTVAIHLLRDEAAEAEAGH